MRKLSKHAEWLGLIEVSGPFLSPSTLEKAFPQGLEAIDTPRKQRLRAAYDEWREAVDEGDPLLAELHVEWTRMVLEDILEYDRDVLVAREDFGDAYVCKAPDCHVTFAPDRLVMAKGDERPRLFVSVHPPGTDLEKIQKNDGWPTPIVERMILLCRTTGVRLGLVTNGERWMLVNAPVGSPSSHTSWYARLWFQEPVTLKAFLSLLEIRRFFGPADETLDALLDESLKHSEEVTDTLGEQVRRAVEVLVQCLDKADQDRNRELLDDVSPTELYEAGLTVMMRLVFVLCAEERGLLLLDDPVYDQNYAISTLRGQLAEEADRHGPEILERRHDAWARLLAVFRAVYGGMEHESLRLPALGGSLFDPDRFPFLEGRAKGTSWRDTSAIPLPIDNRTVLLLLEALQLLEQQGGALLLSYKALDVENIGHVYEGLLEHTVARVPEVTLGLVGSQKARNPNVTLRLLEEARATDERTLSTLLLEVTQRSESAIRNTLARPVDEALSGRVSTVCGGDTELTQRVLPFAKLLRTDAWEEPIVYRANSFMVTLGADRRETGTHYTPKSLTETIVATTLEPVAFVGPAEGMPREEWRLKTPTELLDLKICDPAMGSGAFLVQACRWLSERLVEAWSDVEREGKAVTIEGETRETLGDSDPMPSDPEDRLTIARRLVAERCLYGVDINPLAVELAKLSIWLVTMAKGYPFGFLDHNLQSGDSLLGIHRLDQLTRLKMDPDEGPRQERIFGQNIAVAVSEAVDIRKKLRAIPIRDIRDVETMARLDKEAREKLKAIDLLADAMIGEALRAKGNTRILEPAFNLLAVQAGDYLNGNLKLETNIATEINITRPFDLSGGEIKRRLFHWPLEFPEVFTGERSGFNAMVGNPPFLKGTAINKTNGVGYRDYIGRYIAFGNKASYADLCAFFMLRCFSLLFSEGVMGLVVTNTISQGDTRQLGIDQILKQAGSIIAARTNVTWPGKASVVVSLIWVNRKGWRGKVMLDSRQVDAIPATLTDSVKAEKGPYRIAWNNDKYFKGSTTGCAGFVLTDEEARGLFVNNPKNRDVIQPFLGGQEFNSEAVHVPKRWVINFRDWEFDKASQYSDCMRILEERVKPYFDARTGQIHETDFWKFSDKRLKGYESISKMSKILFHGFTSKYVSFDFVPTGWVYSAPHIVLCFSEFSYFAVLQSNIHLAWVFEYCSTMGTTLRYAPSDVFDTFPFPICLVNEPTLHAERLGSVGVAYHRCRSDIMVERNQGLTETYNLFNDSKEKGQDIEGLRDLQIELDNAAMASYGWTTTDLQHGFHESRQGIRFTISPQARIEVLQLLLELNHERYHEEVRLGLHSMKKIKT